MRVLFVTNTWPDENAPWRGPWIKAQAESLRRRGLEISTVVIPGHLSHRAYVTAAARVTTLNRWARFEVVHAHYGTSAFVARLYVRAPLVISFLGSDILGPGSVGARIEGAAMRRLAYVAKATITMSSEMERLLPSRVRDRNSVIPHGVDLDRFRPRSQADARRRLGWPPDEKVVLFAGTPNELKGFPLARAAVDTVCAGGYQLSLRVARGVSHEEMPDWFNAADVLLFPSRSEGSPNVVKEAMACTLPVVATPVGDIPDLFGDVEGCFVRSPEPEPLAEGVVSALRAGRTPAGRLAVQPQSLDAVAERLENLYNQVCRHS